VHCPEIRRFLIQGAGRLDHLDDIGFGIGGQQPPNLFRGAEFQHSFNNKFFMLLGIELISIHIPKQMANILYHPLPVWGAYPTSKLFSDYNTLAAVCISKKPGHPLDRAFFHSLGEFRLTQEDQ
jgi:hypothetical protein